MACGGGCKPGILTNKMSFDELRCGVVDSKRLYTSGGSVLRNPQRRFVDPTNETVYFGEFFRGRCQIWKGVSYTTYDERLYQPQALCLF